MPHGETTSPLESKRLRGIFVSKADINTPYGSAVGTIADYLIAAGPGVSCCYCLTFMGKDKYFIRGAALGAAEWTALYGSCQSLEQPPFIR